MAVGDPKIVPVDVHIRRTADGLVRVHGSHEINMDPNYAPFFIWTDGNFACDCNRFLFFERAVGREPTEEEDEGMGGCGHERYLVRITRKSDGVEIYKDENW